MKGAYLRKQHSTKMGFVSRRRKATRASTECASPDGGSLLGTAFLHAHGAFDHFQFFCRSDVFALIGDHVDNGDTSALLGPIHQLFQLLLAGLRSLSLLDVQAVTVREVIATSSVMRMGAPVLWTKTKTGQ